MAGGANVIMMSKGMIRIAQPGVLSRTTSLALLLSASASPDGDRPEIVQIAEVEEALAARAPTRWCCSRRSAATPRPG